MVFNAEYLYDEIAIECPNDFVWLICSGPVV
jgi:hypothetical protein